MSCYTVDGTTEHPIRVYAYLNSVGRFLYVGQSYDLPTRHGAHRKNSPWFAEAAERVVLSLHVLRSEARVAEAAAIRTHRPVHNVMHNRKRAPNSTAVAIDGNALRILRIEAGIGIRELAEIVGVDRSHIGGLETRNGRVSPRLFNAIMAALDLTDRRVLLARQEVTA